MEIYTFSFSLIIIIHRHYYLFFFFGIYPTRDCKPKPLIKSVACTGLGTFYGEMNLSEAARLMALAYRNHIHPPKRITWSFANVRQKDVGYGGYAGLLKAQRVCSFVHLSSIINHQSSIFSPFSQSLTFCFQTIGNRI